MCVIQDVANDLWKSTFKLEQSMSVHALYGRDREQVRLTLEENDVVTMKSSTLFTWLQSDAIKYLCVGLN